MTDEEVNLGYSILEYLRNELRRGPYNKFNVIGRSGQGEFEISLNRKLSEQERQTAIWLWDELRRLRLISPTGTDLVVPDDWVLVTSLGENISKDDFANLLTPTKIQTPPAPDAVTGLRLRLELNESLSGLSGNVGDSPVSFLMLDIDFFKKFNDQFGHQVGDEILGRVGQVIVSVVTGKGQAFRYGGEELTVLLPNHTIDEALPIAERIRKGVEDVRLPQHPECRVTASLGVASFPDTCTAIENLAGDADRALYEAKEEGRNCVRTARRETSGRPVMKPASAKLVIRFAPEESEQFCQFVLAVDSPVTSLWSPPVTGYGSAEELCNARYIRCRISNVGGRAATRCVVSIDQVSCSGAVLEPNKSALFWTHSDNAAPRALAVGDEAFVDVCAVYRGGTEFLQVLSEKGRKGYGRLPRPGEYVFAISATDFDSGSQDSVTMTVLVGAKDWDDMEVQSFTSVNKLEQRNSI